LTRSAFEYAAFASVRSSSFVWHMPMLSHAAMAVCCAVCRSRSFSSAVRPASASWKSDGLKTLRAV